eukprot:gene19968-21923_t
MPGINHTLILVGFAFAIILVSQAQASSHCDKDVIYPLAINITKLPKTLIIKKGEQFHVSTIITVRKRLPVKYKIDIDLWKKIAFWVKIPCISGGGSCDYEFDCAEMNCTQYLDMCTNCKISVENLKVTVPINISVPSFLVNGHYWIGYKILNGEDGSKVACGEKYFNIKI